MTLTFDHLTWKSIGIIYSLRGNYCSQSSNYQTNMYKEIEQKTLWTLNMKSTLSFWWNECEILWRHPLYQVKYLSSKGRINYWVDNILDEDTKFGLEFWPHDLKIGKEHLFSLSNLCTKIGYPSIQWVIRYWVDNI